MGIRAKFKVTLLAHISGRNVVVVAQLNSIDFKIKVGMYLGNIKILGCDIPRIKDVKRKKNQILMSFGLKNLLN
ncbi:MAG: hypothetical protein AB8B80_04245 [Marinicellaceae bacterium]